jgi:hypothetical protein
MPGDKIVVRRRGGESEVVFERYNPRARKYPLCYEFNGQRWKAPMSAFVQKVEA